MKLWKITIALMENEGDENEPDWQRCSDSEVQCLTLARDIPKAAEQVITLYTKADETEKEFKWVVIKAEQLPGLIVIPALPKFVETR